MAAEDYEAAKSEEYEYEDFSETLEAGSRRAIRHFDILDWLLCSILASSCAYVAGGGFYVSEAVQNDPLLAIALPFAMIGFLVLQQRGGRLRAFGLAAYAVIVIAIVGWAISSAPEGQVMADIEANPTIFVLVLVVSTALTFFLSRTTVGLVALIFFAVVDVFVIEFLYQNPAYTIPSCIAIVALVALVAFSRIRLVCFKGSAKNLPHGAAFGSAVGSIALAIVLVGVACAAFVFIIAPLNPPVAELEPFRTPIYYDLQKYQGIVDIDEVPNEDLQSQEQEGDKVSDKVGEEDSAPGADAPPAESLGKTLSQFLGQTFSIDSPRETYDPYSYERNVPWPLIIVLAVIVAIVVAIVAKRRLRARWLAKCSELPAGKQVVRIYEWLQKRLKIVGLGRYEVETPAEYLDRNQMPLDSFFGVEGDAERFAELTAAFEDARYGHLVARGTDVSEFYELVRCFPKCASYYLGRPGYLKRYFRI